MTKEQLKLVAYNYWYIENYKSSAYKTYFILLYPITLDKLKTVCYNAHQFSKRTQKQTYDI